MAGFGDHYAAVGVADEHHRAGLRLNHTCGSGDIVGQGDRRMLHDADTVAILPQDRIHAFPPGAVHGAPVHEHNGHCCHTGYVGHDALLPLSPISCNQHDAPP